MKIQSTIPFLALPFAFSSVVLNAQEQKAIEPEAPIRAHRIAPQKPPALLAKQGKNKASPPLKVESLDVQTVVTGNTAETTMTMTFRNDTDRILEGELVFPLGQGMTISGYALEVNGKMREGVIVPKDLARKVYEDTIRQQIDPGLVEWTKGNNFRTRIYPVPAKGTKKVSISYVETLTSKGDKLNFQLPLAFKEKIADFSLDVKVIKPNGDQKIVVAENAGLNLKVNDEKHWSLKAKEKDFTANKSLQLELPHENVAKQLVFKSPNDEIFFYALDEVKNQQKIIARKSPSSVHLIWDASNSGAKRSHDKELALLSQFLKKSKTKKVTLQILRNTLEDAQKFNLDKGSDKLIAALKAVRYDGATRLDKAKLTGIESDAIVFVSAGVLLFFKARPDGVVGAVAVVVPVAAARWFTFDESEVGGTRASCECGGGTEREE